MATLSKTQVHELLRILDLLTSTDPKITKELIFKEEHNLFNRDKFKKIVDTLHAMKDPHDSDSDEYHFDILSNMQYFSNI